jgi:hypothetical protein
VFIHFFLLLNCSSSSERVSKSGLNGSRTAKHGPKQVCTLNRKKKLKKKKNYRDLIGNKESRGTVLSAPIAVYFLYFFSVQKPVCNISDDVRHIPSHKLTSDSELIKSPLNPSSSVQWIKMRCTSPKKYHVHIFIVKSFSLNSVKLSWTPIWPGSK